MSRYQRRQAGMKVVKFVSGVLKDSVSSTVDGLRYVNKSQSSSRAKLPKQPKSSPMRMPNKPSPVMKNIKMPKPRLGQAMRNKLNRESVDAGKEPRF